MAEKVVGIFTPGFQRPTRERGGRSYDTMRTANFALRHECIDDEADDDTANADELMDVADSQYWA